MPQPSRKVQTDPKSYIKSKIAEFHEKKSCSWEGMMLKLKLQHFDHLMRSVDSLEKTWMLGGLGSG